MRKFRTLKSKKTPLKPKLKWLVFFGFVVLSMGVFYFVFRFVSAYKNLQFAQVYLFTHSTADDKLWPDAILIKSAVVGKAHQLVYLSSTTTSMPVKSADSEKTKIFFSNELKLPIDQVVFLPHQSQQKFNLISQVLFHQGSRQQFFHHLAEKINLIAHILTAETMHDFDPQSSELSGIFLERSLYLCLY